MDSVLPISVSRSPRWSARACAGDRPLPDHRVRWRPTRCSPPRRRPARGSRRPGSAGPPRWSAATRPCPARSGAAGRQPGHQPQQDQRGDRVGQPDVAVLEERRSETGPRRTGPDSGTAAAAPGSRPASAGVNVAVVIFSRRIPRGRGLLALLLAAQLVRSHLVLVPARFLRGRCGRSYSRPSERDPARPAPARRTLGLGDQQPLKRRHGPGRPPALLAHVDGHSRHVLTAHFALALRTHEAHDAAHGIPAVAGGPSRRDDAHLGLTRKGRR